MAAISPPHDPADCASAHFMLKEMVRERDRRIAELVRPRWWQLVSRYRARERVRMLLHAQAMRAAAEMNARGEYFLPGSM